MDQPEIQSNFKSWAIVEVMGHKKYAGLVTEQVIGGASFVRVDVPASDDRPAFSKMFGAGSIYCITPCTEETARRAVAQFREVPFYEFSAPQPARIGGPSLEDLSDEDDGWG